VSGHTTRRCGCGTWQRAVVRHPHRAHGVGQQRGSVGGRRTACRGHTTRRAGVGPGQAASAAHPHRAYALVNSVALSADGCTAVSGGGTRRCVCGTWPADSAGRHLTGTRTRSRAWRCKRTAAPRLGAYDQTGASVGPGPAAVRPTKKILLWILRLLSKRLWNLASGPCRATLSGTRTRSGAKRCQRRPDRRLGVARQTVRGGTWPADSAPPPSPGIRAGSQRGVVSGRPHRRLGGAGRHGACVGPWPADSAAPPSPGIRLGQQRGVISGRLHRGLGGGPT